MVLSMTGYGKTECFFNNYQIEIEGRTLNNKFLDVHLKVPEVLKSLELEIKKNVGNRLERGRVELSLKITQIHKTSSTYSINQKIVEQYISALKKIAPQKKDEDLLDIAIKLPETLTEQSSKNIDQNAKLSVMTAIEDVLDNILVFRKSEGKSLEIDLKFRCNLIKDLSQNIIPYDEERKTLIKQKLNTALNENLTHTQIDKNRFEQELIYYLEKLDITEECVRLKNHLQYFVDTLNSSENSGKKLGFIAQEIGREINTMGSKCQHLEIQKIVVEMKNELEKIKEQLLNVL